LPNPFFRIQPQVVHLSGLWPIMAGWLLMETYWSGSLPIIKQDFGCILIPWSWVKNRHTCHMNISNMAQNGSNVIL
jgi:hypothetical protein